MGGEPGKTGAIAATRRSRTVLQLLLFRRLHQHSWIFFQLLPGRQTSSGDELSLRGFGPNLESVGPFRLRPPAGPHLASLFGPSRSPTRRSLGPCLQGEEACRPPAPE